MARQQRYLLLVAVGGLAVACSGEIDGGGGPASRQTGGSVGMAMGLPRVGAATPGASGATGSGGGGATLPGTGAGAGLGAKACMAGAPAALGGTPLRRLTRDEYDNTIRDLIGVTGSPASGFPPDESVGGFDSNAIAPVGQVGVERYMDAASKLARAAATSKTLVPCDVGLGDDRCARGFIERFGRRAYRRPLDMVETDALYRVFTEKRARSDFASGLHLVAQAVLASPSFLYRPEFGVPVPGRPELVSLNPYELASRLSYFLWSTMPDEPLFGAAEAGQLQTPAHIEAQVRRMLADAKAERGTVAFHLQWLAVDAIDEKTTKDAKLFPEFSEALRAAMKAETSRFAMHVMRDGGGKLGTLLRAPFSFVNGGLAKLYGVPGIAGTSTAMQKVDLPAGERSGLLTQASVLAVHADTQQTSPVKRGAFVRVHMLCQDLPPPPASANVMPPKPDPKVPTRVRFEQHRNDPACSGCHTLIDPLGFAFEGYDAIGKWRTTDAGLAVDTSGEITGTRDVDGPITGALDLGRRLESSAQARECVARQWFRFALGRSESTDDECAVRALLARLDASGQDVREMLVALAMTDSFRGNRVAP